MKYQDLPDHVRRFLLTSVPSVPYLEAILLLRGDRDSKWSAAAVAARLYLPEASVVSLLDGLAAAGIARASETVPPVFSYQPATAELAAMLDDVAKAYSDSLVKVTDVIHSRMDRRAQQFADAFRWRKDS